MDPSLDTYCGLMMMFPIEITSPTVVNMPDQLQIEDYQRISSVLTKCIDAGVNDFQLSQYIMDWMTKRIHHNGNRPVTTPTVLIIQEAISNPKKKQYMNCASLSRVLTDCLRSYNIPAYAMGLFPCSPYDTDNHVVCQAYSKSLNKWVMLDPTTNSYFLDENDIPLDTFELRQRLAARKSVKMSKQVRYKNSLFLTPKWKRCQIKYIAKDLFYFRINIATRKTENFKYICPTGFDVKTFMTEKHKYIRDRFGSSEETARMAKLLSNDTIFEKFSWEKLQFN